MSSDEMFSEAADRWDLERLYRDLAEAKRLCSPRARKGLTEREKLYLRGLLCGCSPREIAKKLVQSEKGVEVYVCKTLYPYLKQLPDVPSRKIENWRNIDHLLEDAGYKRQSRSSVTSKTNSSVPIEPLVKIVNLGVEQHTISIDINIKLALPSDAEDEKR
ncbi:LuxR C-terminal-related transcriptional regulator [Roseofilum sp. BLCC_M91]|uniref:LuxR C-terminal-related transcriptional regulator n=1 Tax=Roseofilum halophilum BLCC-M91 TaxID=3022259 RepID=A0ABT7BHW9_9CYAN|nr:LuxR C-terminal-related transcriptional regulator [Roseofilum halophilum]MDJ1178771.1 LuxR C-terminal-related transcriptional regulator [Roseofilum halophilum BLCC-M91]